LSDVILDGPMKLLFQHTHTADEIAGVLSYINALEPELQARGVSTQTISTKTDGLLAQIRAIAQSDIVHMNSNHLGFALLCKLLGKTIILKYHYLFYRSTHSVYEPMNWGQRLRTELQLGLPKRHYPLKWKLYAFVTYARLATRLATAGLADRRVACSQFLAESCCFPTGVLYNPAAIAPAPPKSLDALTQPYTFAYVGRLSDDKGVDLLLRATQILRQQDAATPFQVVIVGDGPAAEKLQALAAELEIADCVQFWGRRENGEILAVVRSAIALVVPSRWQEPAGYVSLEASSVQTVSIVARVGGLPELAGPSAGLFEREDSAALAALMAACLADPAAALERGRQAYESVLEQFPPAKIADQLMALCEELQPHILRPPAMTASIIPQSAPVFAGAEPHTKSIDHCDRSSPILADTLKATSPTLLPREKGARFKVPLPGERDLG
jgi:glycogen synthase